MFTEHVIIAVHRLNAHKIGLTFKKASDKLFYKVDDLLNKHKMKAFIPPYLTERIGVIKVPNEMSNKDRYKNIVCDAEIIPIKNHEKDVQHALTLDHCSRYLCHNNVVSICIYSRYRIHHYVGTTCPTVFQMFNVQPFRCALLVMDSTSIKSAMSTRLYIHTIS